MDEPHSLHNIDSLLIQLAFQTRELCQNKNEIQQQIKVYRADIAERMSHIETVQGNIKKLEEEISVKQSTGLKNKETTKSMKVTNSLLLQYEQTLKADLESRKASYNHDLEVYEERMSGYRKTFQSHKETYLQSPVAQMLLVLLAEKEDIENRIKACDDQIMTKQKELDNLTDPAVNCVFSENLSNSVCGTWPITEQEEQLKHPTEEENDSSTIDIASIHLNQTITEHETSVEANVQEIHEQNGAPCPPTFFTCPKKANGELWSYQQVEEQSQPDEMRTEAHDEETPQDVKALEQQLTGPGVEDLLEDEMQNRPHADKENPPTEEHQQEVADFPQTASHEANPQSFSEKAFGASTPTFQFNFSPTSSPRQCTSDSKSPAFLFSINSNVSTPSFPGFGFAMGSSQDEDSSFAFTGSLFNEKKATEAKPSGCPEFLFEKPEQSDDFQFAFAAKSPRSASGGHDKDEFPFSFNF